MDKGTIKKFNTLIMDNSLGELYDLIYKKCPHDVLLTDFCGDSCFECWKESLHLATEKLECEKKYQERQVYGKEVGSNE